MTARVAIVTGGGRGIGRAIAKRLAQEGASVALLDIRGESATEAAEEIIAAGHRAVGLYADVSDEESVRGAVRQASRLSGRLTS